MSEKGTYNTASIEEESGEIIEENVSIPFGASELELHLPKLEDVNHPFVPDTDSKDYIAREINGVSDLELLSYVVEDPDYFAMLEGEAAVGKNMAIDTLLGAANWPRVRDNFGMGTTYENLVGRYAPAGDEGEEDTIDRGEAVIRTAERLAANNNNLTGEEALEAASASLPDESTFKWVDGLLTRSVKNGWAFIADEINSAEEEAIMPLNGLTEDRNSRYLTIEEKSEIIEPHPRFRFIATRNPITYAGVGDMNSALESRGYIIEFDYHEAEALKEIMRDNTNIVENEGESALDGVIDLANDIRRQEQAGNDIMTKISTRDLIKTGRLTDIMNVKQATETIFLGVADKTDEQSIRSLIQSQKFH